MMIRLALTPGMMAPWYYGLAYRNFEADLSIFYPVPFHLIVRWVRSSWWWFRFHGVQNGRDIELRDAFNRGRKQGVQDVGKSFREAVLKGSDSLREWLDQIGLENNS